MLSRALPLLAALMSLLAPVAHANETSLACYQESCLGFHLGSAFARISNATSNAPIAGVHLGIEAQVPLSDLFSLVEELNLSRRGGKDFRGQPGSNLRLDFVELPLMIRVRTPVTPTVLPYFQAGPAVATVAGAQLSNGAEIDTSQVFGRYELSIHLGAGVAIPFPFQAGSNLEMSLRYIVGMRGMVAEAPDQAKTRTILATLSYQMPF